MENTFRCMKCGNNIIAESAVGLECHICKIKTELVEVTEDNANTLIASDPIKEAE